MSVNILRVGISLKDENYIIITWDIESESRDMRCFWGKIDQPLNEVQISGIELWRDGGTVRAQTSLGNLDIGAKSDEKNPGHVGSVAVRRLVTEEFMSIELKEEGEQLFLRSKEPVSTLTFS